MKLPAWPSPPRSRRRAILERIWVVVVIAYGAGRAFVVWKVLGKYGVNPWVYLALDVISSWPYGIATARLITKILDRQYRSARNWAVLAGITFLLPDIYILLSARSAPAEVYTIVIGVIAALTLIAIGSIYERLRKGRRIKLAETKGE